MEKVRDSNIELLRIVAFLMVICIHVSGVGLSGGALQIGSYNWELTNILNSLSRVSVPCFVLISGYFMSSQQISISRAVKKLWFPLVFYALLIYLAFLYKLPEVVKPFSVVVKSLLTSGTIYYHFWYVYVYLGLMVLAPFVNIVLNNLSKDRNSQLLFILYFITCLIPTANQLFQESILPEVLLSNRLLLFITLYIQGSYIRMYGIHLSKKSLGTLYILSFIVVALLTSKYSIGTAKFVGTFYDYANVFVIVGSVSLFSLFVKLELGTRKIINEIAGCSYGGYLVHVLFIFLLQSYLPKNFIPFISYESKYFVAKNIIFIGAVFCCSIFVEFIRLQIIRCFSIKIKQ